MQGKSAPERGGKVNKVRIKLRMPLVACALAATFALRFLSPAHDGQAEDALFLGTGQLAARTLAHSCAVAPSPHNKAPAQAALDALPPPTGFVWAAVLAPDGHVIARKGTVPTGRRWNAGTPWTDLPAAKGQAGCTVFLSRVPLDHPGTVAYVALNRAAYGQAARRRAVGTGVALAVLAAALLAGLLTWRVRGAAQVRRLTQNARRIADETYADGSFSPGPAAGGWAALTQALNDMLAFLHRQNAQVREDEAKFRSLFENAAHGVWQATPHGSYLCLNPAMAAIYGYATPDDLKRTLEKDPSAVYVSPERRAEFLRLMREQNGVANFESKIKSGDGRMAWVSETVRVVPAPGGAGSFWEGTVEDVTARKRAESDRAHLGSHLRLLLEASGEGIYGVDAQGQCTFINAVGAQMLGYTVQEVLGRGMHALAHHSHPDRSLYPQDRSYLYQSVQTGQRFRVDHEVLWRKNGTCFPAEYTASPLIENGRTAGAVVTFVDITSRKAVEAEQARLLEEALERADHDPLTALLNHRAFHKRLDEEADRAQRAGSGLAVALLDIDNFKFFNDVYGHKVGDEVLCLVADALRSSSRSYDVLARFGGDEFAVLMPCGSGETSASLAEQLNKRLAGVSYRLPDHDVSIPLGLSLGLAVFPTEGPTRTDVLETADDRLRRAKTGGDEDGYAERVRNAMTDEREGFSMLDALVTAVDNKDRYTRRHSEDVMRYSAQIAGQMGLDADMLRLVEVAALIHDVGKIGVPDSILRKPGQLSDDEFAAIQQHPIMGAVIAESVPGFEGTLDAIRHHHERWDGKGYPSGLAGEAIPFVARLMAVADSYSAMTTDRPYRKGMDVGKALGILRDGAGVQWDPHCVAAFLAARSAVSIEAGA